VLIRRVLANRGRANVFGGCVDETGDPGSECHCCGVEGIGTQGSSQDNVEVSTLIRTKYLPHFTLVLSAFYHQLYRSLL